MPANYPCDLHAHTVASDGRDTVEEIIANAKRSGVRILAITDHDVLPHSLLQDNCAPVKAALEQGICLIPGVEFSCDTAVEDVHIVGLGCDWNFQALRALEQFCVESKRKAYGETLDRLSQRGCPVSLEDIIETVGAPLTMDQLQKKQIFETMARKGYAPDWKSAKLMVRDDPYLNVKREKPMPQTAIQVIREGGGVAILAHPFLIDAKLTVGGGEMSRERYIDSLIRAGLSGIEIRYPYDKSTCKDSRANAMIWAEVERRYSGRLELISGGSDYHADHKAGVAAARELGECGLTFEEFLFQAPLRNLLSKAQEAVLTAEGMDPF